MSRAGWLIVAALSSLGAAPAYAAWVRDPLAADAVSRGVAVFVLLIVGGLFAAWVGLERPEPVRPRNWQGLLRAAGKTLLDPAADLTARYLFIGGLLFAGMGVLALIGTLAIAVIS